MNLQNTLSSTGQVTEAQCEVNERQWCEAHVATPPLPSFKHYVPLTFDTVPAVCAQPAVQLDLNLLPDLESPILPLSQNSNTPPPLSSSPATNNSNIPEISCTPANNNKNSAAGVPTFMAHTCGMTTKVLSGLKN